MLPIAIEKEYIMNLKIRNFEIEDYKTALELWKTDDNIGLSSADNKAGVQRFLKRNPRLSKVAVIDKQIVATVLCGQDGRRGYLYHLYVDPNYRRKGLARMLVEDCLRSLRKENIQECHLFVFNTNKLGKNFWNGTDWGKRSDIIIFSRNT